ncbi:unnamed protein product [Camellia sinensis]
MSLISVLFHWVQFQGDGFRVQLRVKTFTAEGGHANFQWDDRLHAICQGKRSFPGRSPRGRSVYPKDTWEFRGPQRVQLARALYQDADVYLLDDPFSAVDAHTATSLFNEYVMGALAGKTVILVTHQVDFLPTFDSILLMSEGKIVEAATYNQLLACSQQFQNLVNAHKDIVGSEKHIKYGSPKSKTLTEENQEGINTEEQLGEPLGD